MDSRNGNIVNSSRPDTVSDEHLLFLDALRESGVTNMFGAGHYLIEAFGISRTEARTILAYWMETFGRDVR